MTKSKDDVAKELAEAHSGFDDAIVRIVRLISEREGESDEPIKLLEVNTDTVPSGVMPVYFGPAGDVPYSTVVVELTGSEYSDLKQGVLELPDEWQIGDSLFARDDDE